jgi:alkylation response protein AidB-like acyl-CoA dehydrogenase
VHCQNDKLGAELLSGIASGASIAALAWQETAGDLGGRTFTTHAEPSGGQIKLTGEKRFVAGAAGADGFIVAASAAAGTTLVWVPADAAGLRTALEPLADGRFTATLRLDGVTLPESSVLARGEIAQAALDRSVDEATVMASAELLGIMSRAFEMTMDYLRTRVQFGRPIGSFQALQHRSVDLYIQEQLSTVVLNDAVDALDERPNEQGTAAAVSRAKARCSDAASLITRQAIQMHGGIGFTEDADVGLYVKRALILASSLGNSAYHRRRFLRLAPADAE